MKNLNQILNKKTERIHYLRHAEQLQSLSLTEFIKIAENKGATILTCSPKKIRLDDGTVKKVIGSYIKYTYNQESVFYIQFEPNPFFGAKGYITQKSGASTGLIDITQVYDNVNEYLVSEKNINQLTNNIIAIEKYLKTLPLIHRDSSKIDFTKQNIYIF